jgi:hypothetical protein
MKKFLLIIPALLLAGIMFYACQDNTVSEYSGQRLNLEPPCQSCETTTTIQGLNSDNSFVITYNGIETNGDFITFKYDILKTGKNALSHWSLDLLELECLLQSNWNGFVVSATLNGDDWYDKLILGYDPTTGVTGIKFDNIGFSSGTLHFEITFDKSKLEQNFTLGEGCIRVATKAGNEDIRNSGKKAAKPGFDCIPGPICVSVTPGTCETAFAFGGTEVGTCFIGQGFSRWGWTNSIAGFGNYSFNIYAAAGQCEISNGTLVGTLNVVYDNGTATVTYNINSPYTLEQTHLYVGSGMFPLVKQGKDNYVPTVAPGQYPYQEDSNEFLSPNQYTITGLTGPIYVIAHAVVCGVQ